MGSNGAIVFVQFFPATGNYIIHRTGNTVQAYSSMNDIKDSKVKSFIQECFDTHHYHTNIINIATGFVSGPKTLPIKQIVYSKQFIAHDQIKSSKSSLRINWIVYSPKIFELTVNTGRLNVSTKTYRVSHIREVPEEFTDFILNCVDKGTPCLVKHTIQKTNNGKLRRVSSYFFSGSKPIAAFSGKDCSPVTEEELEGLGLYME